MCDLVRLDEALAGADLVITGEGALDAQTLRGKAPAEVEPDPARCLADPEPLLADLAARVVPDVLRQP